MNSSVNYRSDLLLFVAGLPSRTTPAQLLVHFENLGKVRLLRLRSSKSDFRLIESNPQNNIRRGFCVLEVFDRDVYEAILERSGTEFQGRKLIITKLRGKKEFLEFASDIVKRRLVVAQVPADVHPSILQDALEVRFGRVRKLARLEVENSGDQRSLLRLKFLIEFNEESFTQRALHEGSLSLNYKENTLRLPFHPPSHQNFPHPNQPQSKSLHLSKGNRPKSYLSSQYLENLKEKGSRNGSTTQYEPPKTLLWLKSSKPNTHIYHENRKSVFQIRHDPSCFHPDQIEIRFNMLPSKKFMNFTI